MGANPRLRGMLLGCLAEGQVRGDVRADADIELAADLIIGVYAWNYRLAAAGRAQAAQLTALFDRQVGLIFDTLGPPQTR
jgi:hypothetical protein